MAIPVLRLWASNDVLSPVPVGQHLHATLPNSTLQVFESDDHWMVREQPEPVADAIRRFLGS